MHLVADYTHPYGKGLRVLRSQCRIRIYSPDDPKDAPVVICSELANNLGTSVTEAAQTIAGEVIEHHDLSRPVWIEHYPPEATIALHRPLLLKAISVVNVAAVISLENPHRSHPLLSCSISM